MGDRPMVRQRSLVICSVMALALAQPGWTADKGDSTKPQAKDQAKVKAEAKDQPKAKAKEQAKSKAPAISIDRRPYTIRVWLSIDPATRIDANSRDVLLGGWKALVKRFVGPPWSVEVAEGEGPLEAGDLHALTLDVVKPIVKDRDKGWFIRVSPHAGGLAFSGREYDTTTGRLGPVCRRNGMAVGDASRTLFLLSSDIFSPVAEIGPSAAGGVSLTVQASSLEAADAIGRVVAPGTVFRPLRIVANRDGTVQKVVPIQATYLRVEKLEGTAARCQIVSNLADPLTKMVVGRVRLVAVGVKPSAIPTKLRYVIGKVDKIPAAGYTLTARNIPTGPPREVGLTDREGRIVLDPGFAEGLVVLRLLAGGVEPLVEFPFMPGEQEGERTMVIPDARPMTVALETKLNALRDEVIDQVALRGRIEARLKAKADANAWPEVKTQLDQFRLLPPRSAFDERLAAAKNEAEAQQTKSRIPVLTVYAQQQIAELQGLMDRYLDDSLFTAYDDALKQAQAEAGGAQTKKTPGKAAPKVAAKGAPPAAAPVAPAKSQIPPKGSTAAAAGGGRPPSGTTSSAPPPAPKPATKPAAGGQPF
jgi:hypothetical protein